ncbi:MAG: hypothetical protein ACOY93_15865 [Bacillota bacterium]
MAIKRILAAASDWRTLIWLGAGIVAAAALSNPFPAVIGLGLYLWAVQKLAQSPALQQAAERALIAEGLAKRYQELQETIREVSGRLPTVSRRGETRSWAFRAQEVVNAAVSLYREWLRKPNNDPERARWVEEALRLAHHYLRIVRAYHEIYVKGGPNADLQVVVERLRRNKARLREITDMEARSLLLRAIEMDERVLAREEDEEAAAERYLAKLAAIESTLDMLRRRMFEPDATNEEGNRVHDLLLEAEAMDQALEEVQHRARVRA